MKRCAQAQQGFTLVELVTIMIILGILSIAVYPRFQGSSGFSEFTYQARLVSALRSLQVQAMQDSRSNLCFQLNFVNGTASPAFGVPTRDFSSANALNTCAGSIDFNASGSVGTRSIELNDRGIELQAKDGTTAITSIGFTSMGRPITNQTSCANGCTVTFSNLETVSVCVKSQGYVHAC